MAPVTMSEAVRVPDLPGGGFTRVRTLAGRALRRRCPYCGGGGIFQGWFSLRERCPRCEVSFNREEGYFLGAYAVNLIVSESIGLGIALYLIFGTALSRAALIWQELVAVALVVALPILFFPYSRTVWMALDLLADPPAATPERRLRGSEMGRGGDRGDTE